MKLVLYSTFASFFCFNLNSIMKTTPIPARLALFCTNKYGRHFTGLIISPASVVVEYRAAAGALKDHRKIAISDFSVWTIKENNNNTQIMSVFKLIIDLSQPLSPRKEHSKIPQKEQVFSQH